MYNVLIWGLGKCYNLMKNTLAYFELTQQLKIVSIVANDAYMNNLDGYPVIGAAEINAYEWDYIFVMSDTSFDAIVENAVSNYGIQRNVLIPYRILQIPNIKLDAYFKLRESKITIISNNCWGGIVYKTLGMECRSPFKNLFVLDNDYVKLLENLNFYMKTEPVFSHFEDEPHSGIRYPVLKIEDIEIHCNHTTSPEKAIADWNRRRKKINSNNLFIEMYTLNKDIAKQFLLLNQKRKSVCFVPWETTENKLMKLDIAPNQKEFWEAVNANGSLNTYGLKYSLVDLLNGNYKFRYF